MPNSPAAFQNLAEPGESRAKRRSTHSTAPLLGERVLPGRVWGVNIPPEEPRVAPGRELDEARFS